jgi:5'-3' exonuclease
MGIEKFFNTIKKTYGTKIITKIEPKTYFPTKFFLIDFNSIIHTVSQSISNSLCYLYHIQQISNIKPNIYQTNSQKIKLHIDNLTTDLILTANLKNPEQSTSASTEFSDTIDLSTLSLDQLINKSFFDIITSDDNLDKLIIHKVATYIISLTTMMPNLKYLYMAIDGVPLFGKMIEQRHRRTIGYIVEQVNNKLLEMYKLELDIDPNINLNQDIYYNHYQFELYIRRLKFNKNKISPATQFMTNLESYIINYLNVKLDKKIQIELDSYTKMGEGEKKIVYKIHQLTKDKELIKDDSIIVYSPDADVILLMLLELKHIQINIFRYVQQLDLIDINQLAKIIIEYMGYQNKQDTTKYNIIADIVMLITLLGNDFLPKIQSINTQKHITNIFKAYIKLNINDKFIFGSTINWDLLNRFLTNLDLSINKFTDNFYRRKSEWTLEPDQIINVNAIPYFTHKFNIEHMANTYEPPINTSTKTNTNINRYCRKYIQGFIWLSKYYLQHNFDYKLFYYKYDIAPTLQQLIMTIQQIIKSNRLSDKINFNLEKSIPNIYFTPETQLIYISPTNITDIIDKKYLNMRCQQQIKMYDTKFNKNLNLEINSGLINIYNFLDCSNAVFLNRCHIKYIKKVSGKKVLKFIS